MLAAVLRRTLAVFGLVAFVQTAEAQDNISTGLFFRADTDGTTVLSPHVGARVGIVDDSTWVEVGYGADIWTSASIDIRTAATQVVTEQRDEITAEVERELDEVRLRGSYRYSDEHDYVSHGGALAVSQELADGNATVETALSAAIDSVSRSGDESFARELSTIGAKVTYTQILDPETILQVVYELNRREGYQASPYRFVGVGGDGRCNGSAQLCLPETHPAVRLRNALVLRVRRALGADFSGGLEYRLYIDDWGMSSHTAALQLAYVVDEDSTLMARYRFYLQTAASFYSPRYDLPMGRLRYVSRDRELSPMDTHRLALSYERNVDLTDAGPTVRFTFAIGTALLHYSDFVDLGVVFAFDATVAATVEL
jgi:hypothetical protein